MDDRRSPLNEKESDYSALNIVGLFFSPTKTLTKQCTQDCTNEPTVNGYIDSSRHAFDSRINLIASRALIRDGTLLDRGLVVANKMNVILIMIWMIGGVRLIHTWGGLFVYLIALALITLGPPIYIRIRVRKFRSCILRDRWCFRCFYSLHGADTDDTGFGHCPECGRRFNNGEYQEPP